MTKHQRDSNWKTLPENTLSEEGTSASETIPSSVTPSVTSSVTPSSVTVELPLEIVNAIHQHCQLKDQAVQTPTEAILEILRSAVQSSLLAAPVLDSRLETNPSEIKDAAHRQPPPDLMAELSQLQARLAELEAYIPKLAALEGLEGKSIAF
jgi:hypothetical protein